MHECFVEECLPLECHFLPRRDDAFTRFCRNSKKYLYHSIITLIDLEILNEKRTGSRNAEC